MVKIPMLYEFFCQTVSFDMFKVGVDSVSTLTEDTLHYIFQWSIDCGMIIIYEEYYLWTKHYHPKWIVTNNTL